MDETTLKVLEKLHFKTDSSVVPGYSKRGANGFWVDHKRCRTTDPYYPAPSDHCRTGNSNILEFPITVYPFLKPLFRLRRALTLHLAANSPKKAFKLLQKILSWKKKQPLVVLVIPFHTWGILRNKTAVDSTRLDNIQSFLSQVIQIPNLSFVTIQRAATEWIKTRLQ